MSAFGERITGGVAGGAVVLCAAALLTGCATTWREVLERELLVLGERNWIVVADSAYPDYATPGIETVATGAGHLEVLKGVLGAVDASPHVKASLCIDAEIRHVEENHAPGISEYRRALNDALQGTGLKIRALAQENLEEEVNRAADTFRVLVLKTDMTLPYTTVFVELERGYFSEEGERALRNIIQPVRIKTPSGATPKP